MSRVLTTAAVVLCGHPPGLVALTSSSALTVGGMPVLTGGDLEDATVAGCPLSSAGGSSVSCTAVKTVTGGTSAVLQVGGAAVLLDSLKGTTDGNSAGVTPQLLLAGTDAGSVLTAS